MALDASDEDLMARVAQGDVFAYTAIVQRHVPAVYRAAQRMLHDRYEAEDVAQESFARLWQSAPQWKASGGGLPAWLRRVCTNLCLDRLRLRGRWSGDEPPEMVDPAIPADRLIEQGQVEDVIEASLRALSGNHRAAIVLTYYEGYPNKAAAEALQMDIKAFESLLHRARQKLGSMLSLEGVAPGDLELLA